MKPAERESRIIDFLKKKGENGARIDETLELFDLKTKRDSVHHALQKLQRDGLVKRRGSGRATIYVLNGDDPEIEKRKRAYQKLDKEVRKYGFPAEVAYFGENMASPKYVSFKDALRLLDEPKTFDELRAALRFSRALMAATLRQAIARELVDYKFFGTELKYFCV